MSKTPALILSLFSIALAAAVVHQAITLTRVRREMADLSAQVKRLESRPPEMARPAPPEQLQQLSQRVSKVERTLTPSAGASTPPPGTAETPPAALTEQQIEKIVEAKMETKRSEESKKGGWGERKVPLRDVAKEIGIDVVTEQRVAEIANRIKDEIFRLARTPRPDGTTLADEIIDAFLSGNEEAVKKGFMKLFSEKVPGTDTTYVVAVGRLQDQANADLQRILPPDSWMQYQHMNVKPDNIETSYDPWGEYVKTRKP